MTKSELIKKIHRNNDLNYVEIEKIVNPVKSFLFTDLIRYPRDIIISKL